MTGFFQKGDGLEGRLRAMRPQPSNELVSRIEARVSETRPRYRRTSFRFAVPAALTIAMISALAAVGGVSYAASSVVSAASSVAKVFVPAKQTTPVTVSGLTSGGDQYKPGYGWGDDNHNHQGPPGVKKGKKGRDGGEFSPPLVAQLVGPTAIVNTSFTVDEQSHLFLSVVDKTTGKKLLITQTKSKAGSKLEGPQAKTINYLVTVPRTIPLKVAIPANLLAPGHTYAIKIVARDPDHNKTTLLIPFTS